MSLSSVHKASYFLVYLQMPQNTVKLDVRWPRERPRRQAAGMSVWGER